MITHSCIARAAQTYSVAPAAIERVLDGPKNGGGLGPMHIPAAWMPILSRVGFPPSKVKADKCTNVIAGTWILAFEDLHKSKGKGTGSRMRASQGESVRVAGLSKRSGVPGVCIRRAAGYYHLSQRLFAGVLATEGGHVGEVHRNENGSIDLGPAQINSTWLPRLKRAGITRYMLLENGCVNIAVGAWILAQAMNGADPADPAGWWKHVGDYNSHTPRFNRRYARLVWQNVLQERR